MPRPPRPHLPCPDRPGRLVPTGGRSWAALLPPDACPALAELHAMLDAQAVELWQDGRGGLFLRDPGTGDLACIAPPDSPPLHASRPLGGAGRSRRRARGTAGRGANG